MSTFTFTPSFPATENSAPKVRKTEFGDGYEQRLRFGLNTDPKEWSLEFNERSDAERDQILAFFRARAGVESFAWADPSGRIARYVCETWNATLNACNLNNIRATFREVFEP
jgi:phage-related protein